MQKLQKSVSKITESLKKMKLWKDFSRVQALLLLLAISLTFC